MKRKLAEVSKVAPTEDFNILTVSFDKNDDQATTRMFLDEIDVPKDLREGWRFTTMNAPEDIERLTSSVGYKYFWSKRDNLFLHPSVYIFISPEGRVMRYLYSSSIDGRDIELAILETIKGKSRGSKITDLTDLFLVACYSYNFEEGKYTINYPLFIAAGAFLIGFASVFVALITFKSKNGKEV